MARVTKACRSAPAVWLALEHLSVERGSPTITPSRPEISELSGIRDVKTISRALTILAEAGWIGRVHVPKFKSGARSATWLRITLRRKTQKTPSTGVDAGCGPVRPKKRYKGRTRKTQKTVRSSPTEKGGGHTDPAPSLMVGAESDTPGLYCEPPPFTAKQPVEKKTHSKDGES